MRKGSPDMVSRAGVVEPVRLAAWAAWGAGISVVPPREDGSKAPVGEWKRYQSTPADEAQMHRWYGPRTGLGAVCGLVSGGEEGTSLNCLDFDDRAAFDRYVERAGPAGLAEVLERCLAGYLEETPSGGRHVLVRCPGKWPTAKLALRPLVDDEGAPIPVPGTKVQQIKTLIETKCEGGYVILAPSRGAVHPSGRPYAPLRGGFDSIVLVSPDEWQGLCDLAFSFDESPVEPAPEPSPRPAREAAGPEVLPGDDFNARASWEDLLREAGYAFVHRQGDVSYYRRAGKSLGISASLNYGGSDRFYCWSTSTELEPRRAYSKFGFLARTRYGGDHRVTAKALHAEGYGTRREKAARPGASRVEPAADDDEPIPDLWPALGRAALHGLAGFIVEDAAPHTEGDPVAILVQMLAAFANLVGRGPHFRVSSTYHYLTLFVALVGATAAGRKGTSWDIVTQLLARIDPEWADQKIQGGLVSGEGLIAHVRDPMIRREPRRAGKNGPVVGHELVTQDEGVPDKRLLVVETELSRMLKAMNRESNTLSDVLRQAWDCKRVLQTLAKNCPNRATAAHVAVIGHATKADVLKHLTETDSVNGFGNRFLWVCVRRSKELPEGGDIDSVDWNPLVVELRRAAEFARSVGRVSRDPGARELWHAAYGELSAPRPGLIGAMLGRAEAQVMRLACVYALLDQQDLVRAIHLEAALALWRYCEASARLAFGPHMADPDAEKLLAALRAAPSGLTRTEVRAIFGGHKAAEDMTRLLTRCLTDGLISAASAPASKGRPAQRFFAGLGGLKVAQ